MLRGRIGDVLLCRRKTPGTPGPRRGLSNDVARLWLRRGINSFCPTVFSLDTVAGSVLDLGRSKSCSISLPRLRRRRCVNVGLLPLIVRARRSCLGVLRSSLRISPFLSEARNSSSPNKTTCNVAKSLVVPCGGNNHSCNLSGSP